MIKYIILVVSLGVVGFFSQIQPDPKPQDIQKIGIHYISDNQPSLAEMNGSNWMGYLVIEPNTCSTKTIRVSGGVYEVNICHADDSGR